MFLFHKKNLFVATLALIFTLSGNFASAAQGALLNLTLGYPRIDSNPVGICNYNQPTGVLSIGDIPTLVTYTSAGPLGFVVSGTLSLTANIDVAGNLLPGGTFVLHGSLTTPGTGCATTCADPLLTGTVSNYGIVDSAPTPGVDSADFRITPTGGSLLALMPVGDQIGATMALEGSSYSGTFASSWSCTRPKALVGPTPPNEICGLSLAKTASPTTIGPITPEQGYQSESENDDDDGSAYVGLTCGCRGKVTSLTLRYNGTSPAQVMVSRKSPSPLVLFQGTVAAGGQFTVSGPAGERPPGNGTLGSKITIAINGGETVKIHTSCSHPIGPGLVVGNFEVISGASRKLTVPLCPIPVAGCPLNQQVAYTYTVTNSNSPITNIVVNDDKLGVIGTIPSLGTGLSTTLTKSACLFDTTTNTATASGILPSGASCATQPASATVQLLPPPPPPPPLPPPPTAGNGCEHGYWRNSKHFQYWQSYKQGQKFGSVFEVDGGGNMSLLMSLQDGGGIKTALNRQAVAALLNASNPNVHYAYTPNQIIQIVRDAYASGGISAAESLLEGENNKTCPLPN